MLRAIKVLPADRYTKHLVSTYITCAWWVSWTRRTLGHITGTRINLKVFWIGKVCPKLKIVFLDQIRHYNEISIYIYAWFLSGCTTLNVPKYASHRLETNWKEVICQILVWPDLSRVICAPLTMFQHLFRWLSLGPGWSGGSAAA